MDVSINTRVSFPAFTEAACDWFNPAVNAVNREIAMSICLEFIFSEQFLT
jgi:hypothetical protein